jgi:pimeloyl-ACP methyl ester carboxylesterase
MRFTAKTSADGVVERDFLVGDVPGALWSPADGPDHAPLVLMGHGGGLHKKTPGQVARAREAVTNRGFHVVAIDAPGHGERSREAGDHRARAEMREAMTAGDRAGFQAVSVAYMSSLTEQAAPVGRRAGRPAVGARIVRRLRVGGEDVARQSRRPSHGPLGRCRRQVPGPPSRPGLT